MQFGTQGTGVRQETYARNDDINNLYSINNRFAETSNNDS